MIDLPAPLPEGERILWEGAPHPWTLLRQIVHPQALAVYLLVLVSWCAYTGAQSSAPMAAMLATGKFAGLGLVALVLLAGVARLEAGATDYVITNRRVMITFGAALGKTLQIPFSRIDSAQLRTNGDGSGDIVLQLMPGQRVSFLMLWPNVRPWKLFRAQPMLRAVPDAAAAAQILSRALAAEAGMAPSAILTELPQGSADAMAAAA